MQSYRFLRDADGNVLAVVTLTVAAIFGTIGLAMSDDSFDIAPWSAVTSAHAVPASSDSKDAKLGAGKDADEGRGADQSAPDTRPDAAH